MFALGIEVWRVAYLPSPEGVYLGPREPLGIGGSLCLSDVLVAPFLPSIERQL